MSRPASAWRRLPAAARDLSGEVICLPRIAPDPLALLVVEGRESVPDAGPGAGPGAATGAD